MKKKMAFISLAADSYKQSSTAEITTPYV